ncbi:uncharacterized protein [Arachis hypogaea]|uniref:uncharacterized protein n=1 Tax=Arachis hypogaea TaxID=3818 RepID=UPI003B2234B6
MKTDNFKPLRRCDDTLVVVWGLGYFLRVKRREEKRREEMLNIKRVFNAVSNYQKRGGGEATHPVGGCGYSCPKTAAFKYRTTDYVTDNAA